jgi:microcystin-dependent protein
MQRIDGAGHVNYQFVQEDAQLGRPPTEITAKWLNAVQEEIAGVIEGLGSALDGNSNSQLAAVLLANFVQRSSAPHFIKEVWSIVANMTALNALAGVPDGSEVIVTDWLGNGHGMAYREAGAWVVSPLALNAFDLYSTKSDGHGYYWFSGAWKIYDIESLVVPPASETELGVVRTGTLAEMLARSMENVLVRPNYIAAYLDRQFVGQVADFSGLNPPSDLWVPAAGQLLNRADYPLLWNYANTGGNLVTDAVWASSPGRYSSGNGSSTFRVPDCRGEFRRGWDNGRGVDAGRALGSSQGDAIRNITGRFTVVSGGVGNLAGAFFSDTSATSAHITSGTSGSDNSIGFNASRVVATAAENRPRSLAYRVFIYAGGKV